MKYTKLFSVLAASAMLCLGAGAMSGSGTKDEPYLIGNSGDYAAFAASVNDGTYGADTYAALSADIDFAGKTYPIIGSAAHPYTGHFDGCGHTLCSVTVDTLDEAFYDADNNVWAVGVFGFADSAHIEDLHIENMTVDLSAKATTIHCGLLCGDYNASTNDADNGFFRCGVSGIATLATEQTTYIGGIVGNVLTSVARAAVTFADCKAEIEGDATAKVTAYGGAIAAKANEWSYLSTLRIKNCVASLTMQTHRVSGRLSHEHIGGIVGMLGINNEWQSSGGAKLLAVAPEFDHCVTTAFDVTPATDNAYCGDIIGYYEQSISTNCYAETSCRRTSSYSTSGIAVTPEKLKTEAFWTGIGYDLTNVWTLTDGGIALRKAEKETFALTCKDGTLTANIDAAKLSGDLLVMALADADGRLILAKTAGLADGVQTLTLTADAKNAVCAKFFLLDKETLAPKGDSVVKMIA